MSTLIEQSQLQKSRFLKYSLLASISVGTIITLPFEGMASSEPINLDIIERGDNGLLQPVINNKFERAKSFGTADNKRKRPPTRRKILVGNETTEQKQNIYTSEPIEQTAQKPEIIITVSSPTVSPTSGSFVTAPNTLNTTPIFSTPSTSPEHIYTTAPGTPYDEPIPHATPNNQHAVVRRLSFSEPQQIEQATTLIKPTMSPKPTTLEITAGIVNRISTHNENAKRKLGMITAAIEQTSGKKDKKSAQKKAPVAEVSTAGPFLNQQRQLDVLTQKQKVNAVSQAAVNKKKRRENEVKRNSTDVEKLITQMNQVQLEQNQRRIAPEHQRKAETSTKHATIKNKNKSKAYKVRQEKTFLQKIHLTKTEQEKKIAENKKARAAAEKVRKEKNKQAEKVEEISNIKLKVSEQLIQMLDYKAKVQEKLQEVERIEAKHEVSGIKKELKNIEKLVSKAAKVVNNAETETSRTALQAMQDKMNSYSEQLDKIEENLKLLTPIVYSSNDSTYKQPPKAKPIMPLTSGVQGILGKQLQLEEKYGYLVPNQTQPQTYTTVLPNQEVADPKSMDSGFVSLDKETDADVGFNTSCGKGTYCTQVGQELSFELPTLKVLGYQDNINQTLDTIARANSIERPILFQNLLKDLERRKQEAKMVEEQAIMHVINNPNDDQAKEQVALVDKLLEKYNTDIKLVRKALEDNKENNSRNNNVKKPLERLVFEAKLPPIREYDALCEESQKVIASKRATEELRNQLEDDPELEKLAIEYMEVQKKQSQLEQDIKAIDPLFQAAIYSDSELSSSYSVGEILSNTESSLSHSSSVSILNNLSSSNVMKLGELKSKYEKISNDYKAKELELDALNQNDPKFKELMLEVFAMSKDKIWLEGEIKHLETQFEPNIHSAEGKPVFSPSSSVDSINSVFSGVDYINTNDPTKLIENKIAALRIYQMAVIVKRQELEQLPSTSSGADQTAQQIKELQEKEVIMHDAINACIADPSKLNNVSFEEIKEALKKLSAGIPESVINVLESKAQEDPEDILNGLTLQEMLSSNNDTTIHSLPSGKEQSSEDEEVTKAGIQEVEDKQLLALPVSSNEYALALSDDSEKECLVLGDGSEDDDNDSGIDSESEEGVVDQLPDSREDNLKTTEVDTVISLKQEVIEETKKSIAAIAPTLNQGVQVVKNISKSILGARLDSSEALTAVAAGDEEESRIKRGLWMRGMYGTNNHGRVDNMTGYRGINKGTTIGFDFEIDNNIVGIAYSNVYSVFKFKNSKNNDKEFINSHVVSIYGQKELPKNFVAQALVSASKNFIKDKTTYSYGDTNIRSNVKHRNHSYNAEALLNYNYLVKNNLVITPNIGLRYGKSRDGVYNEIGINVQEIALTMKENNILSGIIGTKVKVPLKDVLKFNNLGLIFQGAVEHNFKEKTQRINRVIKILDNTFKQYYLIPKQPKISYNLGVGIMGSIKNTTISLDYNYYLNKHYQSHQGSVKLKVNL